MSEELIILKAGEERIGFCLCSTLHLEGLVVHLIEYFEEVNHFKILHL